MQEKSVDKWQFSEISWFCLGEKKLLGIPQSAICYCKLTQDGHPRVPSLDPEGAIHLVPFKREPLFYSRLVGMPPPPGEVAVAQ